MLGKREGLMVKRFVLTIGLMLSALALVYSLSAPEAEFTPVGHLIFMGFLTFPSGLIVFYGITILTNWGFSTISWFNTGCVGWYVASWLGMVLVGYLQWFYFLPRVIRELRFRFA
jgi:hypothetical protein